MNAKDTTVTIPLRNRAGEVIAHALIDARDAALAEVPWYLGNSGYAERNVSHHVGRGVKRLHRVILGLVPGDGLQVDHVNGDRLDCRRANLRIASHAENGQNVASRGGSSQFRGVTWDRDRGKWRAQGKKAGHVRNLGRFDSEDAAAEAAMRFRLENLPYTNEDRRRSTPGEGA